MKRREYDGHLANRRGLAELLSLGNKRLQIARGDMTYRDANQAREYFSRALQFLSNDPKASLKQVARTCHKLAETSIRLSMLVRARAKQKDFAFEAQQYGEASLANLKRLGDECMIAQVEFLLVCITAWQMYLRSRDEGPDDAVYHDVQAQLENSLKKLRRFEALNIQHFQKQRDVYLAYLQG